MSKLPWVVNFLKKTFSSRFKLARMTNNRVFKWIIDSWLFKNDEIYYLPKEDSIIIDNDVGDLESIVLPSAVVEHCIDAASFHWIMNFCICREASQCQNYPIDLGCLFLGEAARGINKKLGRAVTKEEAKAHLQKCRDAGLVHLLGRNKLDTVWLNVKPGTKLMTICNCDPCCCLWMMIPELNQDIASKVSKMPGVSVTVDPDKCFGCGTCADGICFVKAISVIDGVASIDDNCRGCGRCVQACPHGAISLKYGTPQDTKSFIEKVETLVDLN